MSIEIYDSETFHISQYAGPQVDGDRRRIQMTEKGNTSITVSFLEFVCLIQTCYNWLMQPKPPTPGAAEALSPEEAAWEDRLRQPLADLERAVIETAMAYCFQSSSYTFAPLREAVHALEVRRMRGGPTPEERAEHIIRVWYSKRERERLALTDESRKNLKQVIISEIIIAIDADRAQRSGF